MVSMNELTFLDASELGRLVRDRHVSPVDVVRAHLDRIEQVGDRVNAIVTVLADQALAEARVAERAVYRGDPLGPLHGVPFTIKDSPDTAGARTARGSLLFADHVPDCDATTVARMRAAGAIALAKTNLPEFSYWTETDNRLTGRSLNPWDPDRTPGGSSGGESAAIAAGLSPIGLGSDVAISVRGPAHDTGVVALKPTRDRVPITGHWPAVPAEFWHVGPLARSVRDIRLALSILTGPDGVDRHVPAGPVANGQLGRRPRVGWLTTPEFGPIDAGVAAVVEAAAAALATAADVEPVTLPGLADLDATAISAVLFTAEILPLFRQVTAGRETELHPVLQRALRQGEVGQADIVDASQQLDVIRGIFDAYFANYDALLCPVCPIPAPHHAQGSFDVDGVTVPARGIMRATVPFNLTGLPALSVPFGRSSDGLPIGVQLVGRMFEDELVLTLGEHLEAISPVRGSRPDL